MRLAWNPKRVIVQWVGIRTHTLMVNENHTDNAAIERQLLRRGCYAYSLIESKQALFMYDKLLFRTNGMWEDLKGLVSV